MLSPAFDTPSIPRPAPGDALLVIDMQRDFMAGGALAVPGADALVRPINAWLGIFRDARLPVFATRDWHPDAHCSFVERGGPWPRHCVAGSEGARFASGLHWPPVFEVVSKGCAADAEAYSGFAGTGLAERLLAARVRRLFVCGVATDYCVLRTVVDALGAGLEVVLLPDCMRAVDLQSGDGSAALQEMIERGAVAWPGAAAVTH
jgi:nicotinamidase/pyrazinamidase